MNGVYMLAVLGHPCMITLGNHSLEERSLFLASTSEEHK